MRENAGPGKNCGISIWKNWYPAGKEPFVLLERNWIFDSQKYFHAYKKFIETVNYKTEDNVSKHTNSFVVDDPSRYVLISTYMHK